MTKRRRDFTNVLKDAGGEDGVETILRKFYKKMAADTMLGYFFVGKDLDNIIFQQKNFLLRAMGAREDYKGKSPRTAHVNLPPILKGHFDRRLLILRETLQEAGLPAQSIDAWVNFENTFREGMVVEEGTKNVSSGRSPNRGGDDDRGK